MREGLGSTIHSSDIKLLKEETRKLVKTLSLGSLMVTLSENGIYYLKDNHSVHVKAHKREIADVSGAGDTVVSISGLCYALGLSPRFIAELANLGGGLVCEHPGVVPVSREKLLKEAGLNDLASCL
jgi:bifunctional ADP-heptose synthase (sugar kinase/adenylyltransferase)